MNEFFKFANAHPGYATVIALAFIGLCSIATNNNAPIKTESFQIG